MNQTSEKVYLYIVEYYAQHQHSPSLREIAKLAGIKSLGHISRIIHDLIQHGFLKKLGKAKRNLVPVLNKMPEITVLGEIAAGGPLEAIPDEERYNFYSLLFPPGTFPLKVKSDSMIEAGIYPDDIVLFKSAYTAANGQIVYAVVDQTEATMKRFYVRPDKVILAPENQNYQPLEFAPERIQIRGIFHKVIGMSR